MHALLVFVVFSECRLRGVIIDVFHTFSPQPANGTAVECARVNAADLFSVEHTKIVLCSAVVVGRFVRITTLEATATLVLCDVQVFRVEGSAPLRATVPVTQLIIFLITTT